MHKNKTMRKVLRVGLDFDGVVAYNPIRIIRPMVAFVKRDLLGMKKLKFFYPKNAFERYLWTFVHESSVFPAKGSSLLRELVKNQEIEAHLITARYSFLDKNLYSWLDRHNLRSLFASITLNKHDNQPHLYKEGVIREKKLDFFIEDNLDIVKYLHGRTKTKVFWIYNLLDKNYDHPYKYPYLEKALKNIIKE